jgi:hypothetical protein
VPFDVGYIVSVSWTLFRERLGTCVALSLTTLALIYFVRNVQVTSLRMVNPAAGNLLGLFGPRFAIFFFGYAFTAWAYLCQNVALLGVARGERAVYFRYFRGGRFLLTSLLATMLYALAAGLVMLVLVLWAAIIASFLGPRSPAGLFVLGAAFLVGLAAAAYLYVRFSQFQFFVIDRNAGVVDSLRLSWEATHNRTMTLGLVYSVFALINLAGFLAFLVGFVFTFPFTNLMMAVTYLALTCQPVGQRKTRSDDWDEDYQECT